MHHARRPAFAAALLLGLAGCATTAPRSAELPAPPVTLAAVGEALPGFARGYLAPAQLPDSQALLPPPPAPGSARMAADMEMFKAAVATSDPARWQVAQADADLAFPAAIASYAAVLGLPVSEAATPHLAMLLRRSMADAGFATSKAKHAHERVRPFVAEKVDSCTPADEAALAKDGSYPSGHSAIGWTLALVMVAVAPERTDAFLKRGYEFGQSRIVCRVHWQSDVEAGRVIGAAVFARLQADPVFQAQLARARAEVAARGGAAK